MKKTIFFLLAALSTTGVWAQELTKIPEHPSSNNSIKFFGKIKSVKETGYDVVEKFGEISKGKVRYTKAYKCDAKKHLTEYDYDNTKTIIKYDEKGRKTEKSTYTNENLDSTIVWKYDKKGNVTERSSYGADKVLFAKIKWKYNDKGMWIEEGRYDSLGNTVLKEIRDYDAQGYYTEHSLYKDGKLEWKCTHKLDSKGNQVENVRIIYHEDYGYGDRDTLWIRQFKYDEFGNMVEFDEEDQRDLTYRKQFLKYNKDEILIEYKDFEKTAGPSYHNYFQYRNSNGDLQLKYGVDSYPHSTVWWCRKYDEKGNLIEYLQKEIEYLQYDAVSEDEFIIVEGGFISPIAADEDRHNRYTYNEEVAKQIEQEIKSITEFDSKTEYVYIFDRHGNWITKTTYEQQQNSLPVCTGITEREIEYYE
ncbi:MAG: hypothetical protein LBR81_06195 [Prevotellaceae bacterium]|jgi:hypothetical protein|nr:hypothetical protein [Prevotellaceae bacterium]